MDNYYLKYIKYKTKYLNLQSGGALTRYEAQELINRLSNLIFNDIPITHEVKSTIKGVQFVTAITPEWEQFLTLQPSREHQWMATRIKPDMEDLFKNLHNGEAIYNDRGQSLLYIALNQGHEDLVNFLIRKGDVDINLLNTDGSSILHGIAWSDKYTFEQKINRIRDIICSANKYTTPLLHKNARGETWLDNLLFKHPTVLHHETIQEIMLVAAK